MPTIQEVNRKLADSILAKAQQHPHAYAGRYVGIANGNIVVITDDLDELDRQLDSAEPDPAQVLILEPALDTKTTHVIWRLR